MENALVEKKSNEVSHHSSDQISPFSFAGFDIAQRMAKALSESDIVPKIYRKNVPNCLIALEISQRCHSSILMTMQNLFIIQDKPSWSSQYIIAALNSCGKFSPLRFKINPAKTECIAYAIELRTGETLEGPIVSLQMARDEGWYGKAGSKWKTMPDLMMRYRAASFFGRLYAPEVLMGLQSKEEIEDVGHTEKYEKQEKDLSTVLAEMKEPELVQPVVVAPASDLSESIKASPEFEAALNETPDPMRVK